MIRCLKAEFAAHVPCIRHSLLSEYQHLRQILSNIYRRLIKRQGYATAVLPGILQSLETRHAIHRTASPAQCQATNLSAPGFVIHHNSPHSGSHID
jgi:hypothetical protein